MHSPRNTTVVPTLLGLGDERNTSEAMQGGMLGLGQSVASAARAVGPVLAGWLYDQGPSWPFILGGTTAMVAAIALVRLRSTDTLEAEIKVEV